MSKSSATDFIYAGRASCGVGKPTRKAITGLPWHLRLRRSAQTPLRSSAARTRSRFPIPSSSQRSSRSATHRDNLALKTDKIYLVGFMAAGKTTLAQTLGRRLRWRAEDVDL